MIAHISDHVFYANANKEATALVSPEVRDNPGIYPPADVRAKLFTLKVQDPKIDRVRTRAWTKVKAEINRCLGHDPAGFCLPGSVEPGHI